AVNLFKLFKISIDSEDLEIENSYKTMKQQLKNTQDQTELFENYNKISTKEKRYLYLLTSTKGFQDISELDKEIISRPNYIGPRQWMELL
ncbi:MAG: hypothetical protein KAH95_01695, partial [Spirochaetales bacterium]|nr:hypothetical protein [Spirochaetales bacterium]